MRERFKLFHHITHISCTLLFTIYLKMMEGDWEIRKLKEMHLRVFQNFVFQNFVFPTKKKNHGNFTLNFLLDKTEKSLLRVADRRMISSKELCDVASVQRDGALTVRIVTHDCESIIEMYRAIDVCIHIRTNTYIYIYVYICIIYIQIYVYMSRTLS